MASDHLRYPAGIALLAVVPVVMFLFGRETPIVGLSVLSVFIIAMSLWYMFGPEEGEGDADADEHVSTGA
ncbi:hypothetical protein VB779_08345 [Haloarculaceae archaeon H-GB11]|nr:hypothetical protein [Haloarculaceae archaeon H-GB11]